MKHLLLALVLIIGTVFILAPNVGLDKHTNGQQKVKSINQKHSALKKIIGAECFVGFDLNKVLQTKSFNATHLFTASNNTKEIQYSDNLPLHNLVLDNVAIFERINTENYGRFLLVLVGGMPMSVQVIKDKLNCKRFHSAQNYSFETLPDTLPSIATAFYAPPALTVLEKQIIAPAVGKGVGS